MIVQSLKQRISVNAQDDKFVQCVSPKGVRFKSLLLKFMGILFLPFTLRVLSLKPLLKGAVANLRETLPGER